MAKTKISIVVPVFNEEKSIKKTVESLLLVQKKVKSRFDSEILFVDDASNDGSYSLLKKIKGIKVIQHKANQGYGASLKTGIRNSKGSKIVITDADGTYPIKDIPKLLRYSDSYDMVVGARTGSNVNVPLMRRPAKWFLNRFSSFMAGTEIPDLNSGLRAFDKDKCEEFWKLYPQKFSFTSTITMAFFSRGYRVKYVPINYFKRDSTSTISPFDFYNFNQLLLRLTLLFNPLKIFSLISAFLFVVAVLVATYSLFYTQRFMDVTFTALVLSSIQILLFGVLAHIIVKYK